MKTPNNYDVKVALEEAKLSLEKQFEGVVVFRDGCKTILGSASLVVTVVGSIQTLRQATPINTEWFNAILVISLILFGLVVAGCIWVISPKPLKTPIKPTWEEYQSTFFGKEERDILKQSLSSYINAIELNNPMINRASIVTKLTGLGFILTVAGMIGLTVIR